MYYFLNFASCGFFFFFNKNNNNKKCTKNSSGENRRQKCQGIRISLLTDNITKIPKYIPSVTESLFYLSIMAGSWYLKPKRRRFFRKSSQPWLWAQYTLPLLLHSTGNSLRSSVNELPEKTSKTVTFSLPPSVWLLRNCRQWSFLVLTFLKYLFVWLENLGKM